jgi:succinate dehydrogenase / fumarate reductase, cytochrome b subunit
MSTQNRPTSPHLTIYKPQITSVLSITHRMTGVALFFGTPLLVGWLYVVAYAPAHYVKLHECLASDAGKALLFGWTLAFYYHLANGIRHLFWDLGKGFTIPQVNRSGWAVLIFTLLMTMFTWGFISSATIATVMP